MKAGAAAAAITSLGEAQDAAHAHGQVLAPQALSGAWKPRVFSPAQNDTVIMLSELIIPATDTPGAKAAQVNRYIDLFLADGAQNDRERFLNGLTWLDQYATKEQAAPFAKLPEAKQVAILEKLDAGNDAAIEDGHRFFRMAKSMTARMYYQTQIGFKELNKGGVPRTWACQHPEHQAAAK